MGVFRFLGVCTRPFEESSFLKTKRMCVGLGASKRSHFGINPVSENGSKRRTFQCFVKSLHYMRKIFFSEASDFVAEGPCNAFDFEIWLCTVHSRSQS